MKKFLLFAVALLGLVACNNNDNALNGDQPIEPGQQITLSANVDFNQGSNSPIRMVAPDTPISGATVNFHWEADDQVMITDGTNYSLFTIINDSISEDGKSAKFTGKALADMSSYLVFYAGKDISKELVEGLLKGDPIVLTNAAGNYNIIAACEDGNESGFTMSEFFNTLRLSLTGKDITLGSVKYYCEGADIDKPSTTINFGTDGLALSATAQEVWLPINATNGGLTFRFYDTNGELIMEKSKDMDSWKGYQDFNELVTFPELEIKKAHFICFETTSGTGTVAINSGRSVYPNLQYSTTPADPDSWATFDKNTAAQTISTNAKLYVRAGDTPNTYLSDKYISMFWWTTSLFATTGNVKVSGNLMALLNQEPDTALTSANDNAFRGIFSGISIVDASELIMPTKVCSNAFWETFLSCSQLKAPPALPAMTLDHHCYTAMFDNCTSLTATPKLPATTLAYECYHAMFRGCTALTAVPELPATQLGEYCYQSMFNGCTGLTSVPTDLLKNNLTLAHSCYASMFAGCTNLTNAPDLPATTLAQSCYSSMFNGCSSLTTAPVLPAETLKMGCYRSMFESCSKLPSVTMLATAGYDWDTGGDGLCKWLLYAGTSVSLPTIYVANDAAKTAIEAWEYEDTPAKPDKWTIVVKP